jgi:hypothetical protein
MEHAKLPWVLDKNFIIKNAEENFIAAVLLTDEGKASADFILEACNNYESLQRQNKALREACEIAQAFMEIADDWNFNEAEINGEMKSTSHWIGIVKAALEAV